LKLCLVEHLLVLISQLLESVLLTRFLGLKHGFFETLQALAGLEPVAPASILVVFRQRTATFLTPLNLGPNDVGEFLKGKSSFLTHELCKRFVDGLHLESDHGRLSRKIVSVFQLNPCQDASVIGKDSVLERDLRRSVQVLVDDDIPEFVRVWVRGFCEQVYVKVVTHLDPGIQDRS
jgi:hypothetical protein